MRSADEKAFIRGFCMRTRRARLMRGLKQSQVAKRLEITRRTYQKCELQTPLPHHLIETFIEITGISAAALYGVTERCCRSSS
jgi:DNA-binding XRE family transcriptional regulator